MTPAAAVLLAGGSGTRVGADRNKVLLTLAGIPVLAHSLRTVAALVAAGDVEPVVVVARADDLDLVRDVVATWLPAAEVVTGGATRADSERAAFTVLAAPVEAGEVDLVAVHDTARPLASTSLWRAVLAAAHTHGGAIPARDLGATLALPATGPDGGVTPGLHHDLVAVSTPQAFAARPLLQAYAEATLAGFSGTDTSSYVERFADRARVATVPDDPENLKVTWPGDVARAEALLAQAGGSSTSS